jgi:hypothetical protein
LHRTDVPGTHVLSVATEGNVPTFFSTMVLLAAAALLYAIACGEAAQGSRRARPWRILSYVFLYLSLDEAAELHELCRHIPRSWLPHWGILYWQWVVVGVVGVVAFVLGSWRFMRRLPRDTRTRFLVAGAIVVSGALGLEMVGASIFPLPGSDLYVVIEQTLEEFLELLGVICFINALLLHMGRHLPPVQLGVESADGPD